MSCWICPLLLIRLITRSSCQPQMVKDISGTALQCFESYLSDRSFKVSWRGVQVTTSTYRGASGLSSWTTSLLCLHGFTRLCHSETWLFVSLLCWWHSTLPLILSWWSDDSCSHLSLSNRHFLLDEGPSPSTRPSQDRTACGSSKTHRFITISSSS